MKNPRENDKTIKANPKPVFRIEKALVTTQSGFSPLKTPASRKGLKTSLKSIEPMSSGMERAKKLERRKNKRTHRVMSEASTISGLTPALVPVARPSLFYPFREVDHMRMRNPATERVSYKKFVKEQNTFDIKREQSLTQTNGLPIVVRPIFKFTKVETHP